MFIFIRNIFDYYVDQIFLVTQWNMRRLSDLGSLNTGFTETTCSESDMQLQCASFLAKDTRKKYESQQWHL